MYPGGPDLDRAPPGPGEPIPENAGPGGRRPEWLKVRLGAGETYAGLRRLLRDEALHTVCEEARCPNQGECWTLGTATFMVLGSVCTRNCGFCAIETGRPPETDLDEPRRVAEAARRMGLRHAVITMVARDDLPDGGAGVVAETVRQIRLASAGTSIEVLISDLNGREADIRTVVEAQPEILNHNVETVPRLYRQARPGGDGHPVPLRGTHVRHLVAGGLEEQGGKLIVPAFGLLHGQDVDVAAPQPREHPVGAGADGVDVPGRQAHDCRGYPRRGRSRPARVRCGVRSADAAGVGRRLSPEPFACRSSHIAGACSR